MKKILMFGVIAMFTLFLINDVNAATIDQLKSWYPGTKIKVEDIDVSSKNYKLILEENLTDENGQDIVVQKGETVTIDLAGHTLTSFSVSAVEVQAGAIVNIIDSSADHTGKIVNKRDVAYSVIGNKGTLKIEGGTISSNLAGHAAILNTGELTIDGGKIETTVDNAFGITNAGKATINGGEFIQGKNYSVIVNNAELKLNGGIFTSKTGESHNALITNLTATSDELKKLEVNENTKADLTITNGEFNTDFVLSNKQSDKVNIKGGKFGETKSIENYLDENLTFDAEGNVIVKKEEPKTNIQSTEKNPNTSDILPLSIGALLISGIGLIYLLKKKCN